MARTPKIPTPKAYPKAPPVPNTYPPAKLPTTRPPQAKIPVAPMRGLPTAGGRGGKRGR